MSNVSSFTLKQHADYGREAHARVLARDVWAAYRHRHAADGAQARRLAMACGLPLFSLPGCYDRAPIDYQRGGC